MVGKFENSNVSQTASMDTFTNAPKKTFSRTHATNDGEEICITGMSGKFPNCRNVDEFEYKLYNKIDMVDEEERRWTHFSPEIPRRCGKIYDLEKFDATFFGVHFKHAHITDPQTRILIETAYEAVLDAGVNPKTIKGSKTGVYVGCCLSESEKTWLYEKVPTDGYGTIGCSRAMMANRISYCLGLTGPSYLVDTACSSSMHALDNAFTAMRNGLIDAAIVGGCNLLLHPFVTLQFARLGVLAKNGRSRPFDKDSTGFTRSEGITCLYLQKKQFAKRIYGIVSYSKTNSDGYKPEGITFPSAKSQERLLNEFYNEVGISPNDLGFLEAHGTGTFVGDAVECRAVDSAICRQRTEPLLMGSSKSNAGHAEPASGIISLIKACLVLKNEKIPPNINFNAPKPDISAIVEGRLIVVTEIKPLPKPLIGVSSFGFGGANAHALLKAFDKKKVNYGIPEDNVPRLLLWAGRTEEAVNWVFNEIKSRPLDAEYIALLQNIQKENVSGFVFRGFGVFAKTDNIMETKCLNRDVQHFTGIKRPLVWVFSGMGSQWVGMGSMLMTIPMFRSSIERCHQALRPKGLDLINILTSTDPTVMDNILHSFVGIAAIQIALVDILRELQLEPDYIIGHSVGELGCGYADGGLTAEQMILASYYRGKVSLEADKIKGSMAAVGLGYDEVIKIIPSQIDVACHNSADSSTISGPAEDVAAFVAQLKAKGIFAKEVPTSNISYHSRYIAHLGIPLRKYLQEIIPKPKTRSSKWFSSSVPFDKWNQPGQDLCSAEYHTNNLLNSVLFAESMSLLPQNSLTIEIAPHGLLQAILKRSMPDGEHISLSHRQSTDNSLFFLSALGKLFMNGVTCPIENLYPKIEFPVSCGTPGISSLIKWDHGEDWYVTKYENMKTKSSAERIFKITLQNDDEEYLGGHIVDGKILVPAVAYLQYVWETYSLMYHGPSYTEVPVEFQDVRFLRATYLTASDDVELTVVVHYGTGNFEITESKNLVVTGKICEIENPTIPTPINLSSDTKSPLLLKSDFYKELRLRGYHHSRAFCTVNTTTADGLLGKIEFNSNWVTFIDGMLQMHIFGLDSRTLLLPTKIKKLRIFSTHHMNQYTLNKNSEGTYLFDMKVDKKQERIVAGGIELIGLHLSPIQRTRSLGNLVLETHQFIPHFPSPILPENDAVRMCVQLALENTPTLKMKIVEVDTDGREPIISHFLDSIEDIPLIAGEYLFLSEQNIELSGISVENGKLSSQSNCQFIIVGGMFGGEYENLIKTAQKSLHGNSYLVVREKSNVLNIQNLQLPENFNLIAVIPLKNNKESLVLLQVASMQLQGEPTVIKVSANDLNFSWIKSIQQAISKGPIILYTQNEKYNGLIGLMNCLRKEPDGSSISCVFIDDKTAPDFNPKNQFYSKQLALGFGINVYRNGQWGTYRHLQLKNDIIPSPRADHVYANVLHQGDLSSFRWFEGPLDPKKCEIKMVYSSINFRDVMQATGRLAIDLKGSSRINQSCVSGFEFSGVDMKTGRRVMSMVLNGGFASFMEKPSYLIWDVPKRWSLQEAATVPVVYITVYYAFFMAADIRKGKRILIHAGTGGVGMAAIRVALAYNLEVFTTCSTTQKRDFLLKTYPQLKASHIGQSRDTSFEMMIEKETNGEGVDFVLNSLSEDKLLASLQCLGHGGHFLEIGKFDIANDNKIGLNCFLKELSFHAIFADNLLTVAASRVQELKKLIDNDIANGIIQPLPFTIFAPSEVEQAFRYLANGKHMGKVLLQIRDDPESLATLPIPVIKQIYFNPDFSYVLPGGLGGFGLELADWMVLRGARKLVLNSRRGISNGYQAHRILVWESYGCQVTVNTDNITTKTGCKALLNAASQLGPVGGIFNLAVILRDGIFKNQTKDHFVESFGPKADATKHLDELSRQYCPHLQHFVMFSSMACGRGNAGQTNYGMANSIMERIVESRMEDGLPAKCIQWGAIGEVGLVAEMSEDKIGKEIGGTLPQRISSCLQELDTLLSTKYPVVSSIVVAEKRVIQGKNENIIETVMNIMGIRDLKSISLSTTLSEMGMDSLMIVEIQKTLERDFELCLSPKDLRSLNFLKLQKFAESKVRKNTEDITL